MSDIIIREARISDLNNLAKIFDCYRQYYAKSSDINVCRDFIQARLNNGDSKLFIAVDDNNVNGFIQIYPSFSSLGLGKTWILNDLYVDDSCRRNGIARAIIAHVHSIAKEQNILNIALETKSNNFIAQQLYKSMGYQLEDQFIMYNKSF